jgi:biopolymer transport protein ExbD
MKPGRKSLIVRPMVQYNAAINVTPLVDVVLVLLIIFMVVTPLLEKELPLGLPETKPVEALEASADQIVVRLNGDAIEVNDTPVADERYVSELRALLLREKAGKRVVFFAAGDDVAYARLITALDGARLAGADVLGMAEIAP